MGVAVKTRTLLIAEGDDAVREALYQALSPRFACVVLAADGPEAVRKSRQIRFDLALIDVARPDRERLQTIAELRRVNPALSIVVMSKGSRPGPGEAVDVASLMGADAALSGTFAADELIQTLENALARRRAAA